MLRETRVAATDRSTWRETGYQRRCVVEALAAFGVASPLGDTASLPSYDGGREREILAWVAAHPATGAWVAIDDMDLELPEGHFVRTDRGKGFTAADGARVHAALAAQRQRAARERRAERYS